ncbi:FadR/GntR family transcriptional regulator [Pseudoroseicyclus tamaricis]|uniref:FadR family transcriptional regulator n=1 Tax=Pseudoroseicyclus tamaricis TaxID=2705421 RepID=A0A6B2JN25_9RHOB|nr:FadR/GntR family transcriptional regulator [Pseudoroseicyclus tamaricis]NDV00067.1 FadR family transcriptional regulator [Pseudoroseicyclus tamaricis]
MTRASRPHQLLSPVVRGSHGQVVEALGSEIVDGSYAEGAHLPRDEELMDRFGVSRTVLREAMKTLAAKGMIEARARVGTTVRPAQHWNMFDAEVLRWHLSVEGNDAFFQQLSEMRLSFEPFAAGLAATRAEPERIAGMRAQVSRMAEAEDEMAFALADLNFHRTVLEATGNAFFHSVGALIEAALLSALRLSSPAANNRRRADIAARHERIVDAIAARDEEAAREAMRSVITLGWERISSAVTGNRAQGR